MSGLRPVISCINELFTDRTKLAMNEDGADEYGLIDVARPLAAVQYAAVFQRNKTRALCFVDVAIVLSAETYKPVQ